MATKNKTALSTMAETLVNSQGGKVKHVPAPKPEPVSLTDLELLDLVGRAGAQVISYAGADEVRVKALAEFNTVGKSLHSAGVVIADGRSKDKQTAVIKKAFLDSMPNLSKGYAQNCYELFRKVVNSGKEIKDFNKSKTLLMIEKQARLEPEEDWRAIFDSGLRGAVYQRHGLNKWVLVEKNKGFA